MSKTEGESGGATGGDPSQNPVPESLVKYSEMLKDLSEEDRRNLVGWLTGVKPKTELKSENGPQVDPLNQRRVDDRDSQIRSMDDSKISKLAKFSGSGKNNEPSFRVWQFTVQNLRQNNGEPEVIHAINRSVTGSAAEVLMRMGHNVTVDQILKKFEHIFGSVISQEQILTNFYTAQQKPSETIAEWSCRLEDILSHPKVQLNREQREEMLKSRFFRGLHHDKIRNAVRHKVESGTYDDLMVLAREAEDDIKSDKAVARPLVEDNISKKMDKLIKDMRELKQQVSGWENRLKNLENNEKGKATTSQPTTDSNKGNKSDLFCTYCKRRGHTIQDCRKLKAKRSAEGAKQ